MLMKLDIIVPTMRPHLLERVLFSLSRNRTRPDLVTIVTNELLDPPPCFGLDVRVIRFSTSKYPFGCKDVALRRNIGIWSSPGTHVLTFDDDQLAPPDMLESSLKVLREEPYLWGHYRYLDFADHSVESILGLPKELGRARESPPNAFHGWQSGYAGLFACEITLLKAVGGFDMAFCGRHAGEDQNLARRLCLAMGRPDRIIVHEPPFAWHPERREVWATPRAHNLCDHHALVESRIGRHRLLRCTNCPHYEFGDDVLPSDQVVMRFDPSLVDLSIEVLSSSRPSSPRKPSR